MERMQDQMVALAETESELRLLKRWLALDNQEFTARSRAWEVVRSRRSASAESARHSGRPMRFVSAGVPA